MSQKVLVLRFSSKHDLARLCFQCLARLCFMLNDLSFRHFWGNNRNFRFCLKIMDFFLKNFRKIWKNYDAGRGICLKSNWVQTCDIFRIEVIGLSFISEIQLCFQRVYLWAVEMSDTYEKLGQPGS